MCKEKSGKGKKTFSFIQSSGLIQQVQLCLLCVELFGFCQKYVPQYRRIFIIQQGSWYFENEVSSITNKGLLSGVCHHGGGEWEGERGKRDPSACTLILQDYEHSGPNCSHISACSVWRPDVNLSCRTGQSRSGALQAALFSHTLHLSRDPKLSHKLLTGAIFQSRHLALQFCRKFGDLKRKLHSSTYPVVIIGDR